MIPSDIDSLRTFLHLVGASIWVGGQLVLAGMVPKVRKVSPEALTTMARAFARIGWPAMAVMIVTGTWSLAAVDSADRTSQWTITVAVKLLIVGFAVAATLVHSVGRSKMAMALGGAIALIASIAAMYLGVLLSHAT